MVLPLFYRKNVLLEGIEMSDTINCVHIDTSEDVQELQMINKKRAKEKQKNDLWKGFVFGAAVTLGICLLCRWFFMDHSNKQQVIRECVDKYYLNEVNEEDMKEGIYKGMIASLGDPYSEYYTKEEYMERMQDYGGSYKGIGVVIQKNPENGLVTIVSCYENSPAEEAGIMAGDLIYKVGDVNTTDIQLEEVVTRIKESGEDGIHLTLIREGEPDYIEVDVVPNDVVYPVVSRQMLSDGVGYLAIGEFKESSYQQFHEAMEDLQSQDMKGLIVDLRNNTGGLMNAVNSILNDILPEGTIVYTVDKNGKRQDYTSEGKTPLQIPMVVLINEYTASASEIFAGAVRDYDMAQLVGTKTFGKGVVQSTVNLSDGSALKLTIANYYTPKGTNIHGTGLEPDVMVELDMTLQEDGTYHDNQLEKGVEVLKAMIQ